MPLLKVINTPLLSLKKILKEKHIFLLLLGETVVHTQLMRKKSLLYRRMTDSKHTKNDIVIKLYNTQ